MGVRLAVDEVVPPNVPAFGPAHLLAGAADHHDPGHVGAVDQSIVDGRLEGAGGPAPVAAVGGYDHSGVAVEDPSLQGVGREPSEHHRVRCADTGASQHGRHRLGNHRHVDGHRGPGPDPKLGQGVGGSADVTQKTPVGDRAGVARFALPVERHAVAQAGFHVAVQAVDRHIEFAPYEPLREWKIPLEGLGPGLPPRQSSRLLLPKGDGVSCRLVVDLRLGVGLGGELGRWLEAPRLM